MVGSVIHALLVGVDAYPAQPLYGCVNDIEAVQKNILARIDNADVRIRRLLSPHTDSPRDALPGDRPATRENIRDELRTLPERVKPGEGVFIYYSGHGVRKPVSTGTTTVHREALVPVDFEQNGALFDYDVNVWLADIAAVTDRITVILDCCHSAGVTRDPRPRTEMVARCLDPRLVEAPASAAGRSIGDVDLCHVVCGCRDHESSYETTIGGVRHGLLTRALVDAIASLEGDLLTVPWSRIWSGVGEAVVRANSAQHVWMSGHPGRAVIAGPPVEGDVGITITGAAPPFTLQAGEIAGLTNGTVVGVYPGQPPPYLYPLDSEQDRKLRTGTLVVSSAKRDRAEARFGGAPFPIPTGARCRIVEPASGRLRCALVEGDVELAGVVAASPLLEVTSSGAQVRIVTYGDQWALIDDAHDTTEACPPLFTFPPEPERARQVLEHYARYILPLQIASRATDLPGKLALTLRAVPAGLTAEQAQAAELGELPTTAPGAYTVAPGTRVALHVRNAAAVRLTVDVVNCAASGKVQMLGAAVIEAASARAFWLGDNIGRPFILNVPPGRTVSVDRVVAIGRTNDAKLDFLRVDRSFAALFERTRGAKDLDDVVEDEPARDQWTAAKIIVRARA